MSENKFVQGEINSPLGRRAMAVNQQRMLTVPNEDPSNQEDVRNFTSQAFGSDLDSVTAMRKTAAEANKRITPSARERVELITNIGRLKEDIFVENVKFTLQSLKSGEIRDILKLCMPIEDKYENYFETRAQTLARSIIAIDDIPIGMVLSGASLGSRADEINYVIAMLNEMGEYTLEYLHESYLKLIEKNKDKFKVSTDNAREVSEEIKK